MLCGTILTHPGEYNLTFDPPPQEINNQRSKFKTYHGKGGIKREKRKKWIEKGEKGRKRKKRKKIKETSQNTS